MDRDTDDACATVQLCHATREVVGTDFEPFANLSPPFRELSPAVFLHHASPCLYMFKHGFLDDPHIVPLKSIEYGFGYVLIRPPYTPYSIYLRGTITLNPK